MVQIRAELVSVKTVRRRKMALVAGGFLLYANADILLRPTYTFVWWFALVAFITLLITLITAIWGDEKPI